MPPFLLVYRTVEYFQSTTDPGVPQDVLKQIPVTAVKVGERMRQLDETKVLELMTSYESIGVINPISVDEDMTLIAGAHRLKGKPRTWDGRPSRQRCSTRRTCNGN